jgi:NADH:ubiquinone oxidoreductase subunit 6 (subunit J)
MISIGATYLGILYIMIYIGAIAVLFLFIIMLINIRWVNSTFYGYISIFILILSFILSFIWLLNHNDYIDNSVTITYIAKYFYIYEPTIILLIAYLLIVAMIASLILSSNESK